MPGFSKGPAYRTPFGKNVPYRSTKNIRDISKTFDKDSLPVVVIDGEDTKVLQPGMILATITATGKVGPYQPTAADGRELAANIVGVNKTFLPTQLMHRDVEVAPMISGSFEQTKCFELDAGGLAVSISDTTADALRNTKTLDCLFY